MNFYYVFLDLCNKKGEAPSKVAENIGSTRAAAYRWKKGGIPTDSTLLKLADYFGVSVEYLKGETENISTVNGKGEIKNPSTITDERIRELYELTADLSEDDVNILRAFAAGLKANRKND